MTLVFVPVSLLVKGIGGRVNLFFFVGVWGQKYMLSLYESAFYMNIVLFTEFKNLYPFSRTKMRLKWAILVVFIVKSSFI